MLAGDFARQAFHSRLSLFLWFEEPWQVRTIFGLGVVAHLLWLVGLYTRPAALVSFVVWASMVGRNPLLYAMPDQMHTCMLLWLALTPSGRGLSLDARWRGKGGPVPVWCRRILQLQIAVVYTTTGLLKTASTWKGDGTAIYYSLVNPYNRHLDIRHYARAAAAVRAAALDLAGAGVGGRLRRLRRGAVAARGHSTPVVPGSALALPRLRRADAPVDLGDDVRGVVHAAGARRLSRVPAARGGRAAAGSLAPGTALTGTPRPRAARACARVVGLVVLA
jgi:hypothetical protein